MNKIIIVAIALVLVIAGAIYSDIFNMGNPNTNDKNQNLEDSNAVSKTIYNFYQKYESCMKNPPAEAAGKVGEYCQNNTGLTTADFASNLEKGGTAKAGADPIICAQTLLESATINPNIKIDGNKAKGFVEEKFGSSTIKPEASLVKENGVWKIDNIVCSKP